MILYLIELHKARLANARARVCVFVLARDYHSGGFGISLPVRVLARDEDVRRAGNLRECIPTRGGRRTERVGERAGWISQDTNFAVPTPHFRRR